MYKLQGNYAKDGAVIDYHQYAGDGRWSITTLPTTVALELMNTSDVKREGEYYICDRLWKFPVDAFAVEGELDNEPSSELPEKPARCKSIGR